LEQVKVAEAGGSAKVTVPNHMGAVLGEHSHGMDRGQELGGQLHLHEKEASPGETERVLSWTNEKASKGLAAHDGEIIVVVGETFGGHGTNN
jgi:hypothetical protein